MSATPGPSTPGETATSDEQVHATAVAIDSTGTTDIGSLVTDQATIKEVYVDSTQQDFDFNVEANGNDIFGSEQSPSAAEESFQPDQNQRVGGTDDLELAFAVSSASATGSATADVTVVVEYQPPN